jgi:flagellar motor switch protein FliN/FliY
VSRTANAEPAPLETVPSPVGPLETREPDYQDLAEQSKVAPAAASPAPFEHIKDVTVDVRVELGRTVKSLGDVLQLAPGAVVELQRDVSEPVDLLVQGVRVARGEVVVVDGHFAVRICEILPAGKR